MRKFVPIVLLLWGATTAAAPADETHALLARAWPHAPVASLSDVGKGVAIVSHRLRTLLIETHGTNGNGLKLQQNKDPDSERSYISVGALQERLEPEGLQYILISACNSGRLLRPAIYRDLDPNTEDKLFLPATCGIINASGTWNPGLSRVAVITPASSNVEMTVVGSVRELTKRARKRVNDSARAAGIKPPSEFVISDMLMSIIAGDQKLHLKEGGHAEDLSSVKTSADFSERLFKRFLKEMDARARRPAADS